MNSNSNFRFDGRQGHIRSGWNISAMLRRGPLTDRKIAFYEKRGYYSTEFRDARRELMQRKQAKREQREGGFVIREGRMIYSPL